MKKDLIALAAIALLVIAVLSPLLFNWGGVFFDDYYETFTRLLFNARSVQAGAFPLWDPGTFAGGRINFIPNTRIWYWPNYPFYLIAPLADPDGAYDWLIKFPLILSWLVCAFTAYGLGRKVINLHPVASAVLALVYAFGAAISYNICDPGTIYAAVWIPLAIWGIAALARSGSRWMGLAGALAISFIGPCGSDVRGIFGLITVSLTVLFWALIALCQESWKRGVRFLLAGVLVFAIGLLLSGPYWTAMVETVAVYRGSSLINFNRSASNLFSMPWSYLLTLVIPDFFGTMTNAARVDLGLRYLSDFSYPEGNISGGFWLILLSLVGSVLGWRDRDTTQTGKIRRRWWLVGALLFLLSLFLITGRNSPVYVGLVRIFPVFGLPYPVRWRVMELLGLSLLSGIAAHWLWTSRRELPRVLLISFPCFVLLLSIRFWLRPDSPGETPILSYAWANYRSWLLPGPLLYLSVALVLSALILLLYRKRIARLLIILAVVSETLGIGFLAIYFLSYGDSPEWVRYRFPSESNYYRWTDYPPLTNLPAARTGPERTTFHFSLLDQTGTIHGGDYLLGHCSKPLDPRLLEILDPLTTGYPYALRLTKPSSRFFPNMTVRNLVLDSPQNLPGLEGRPRLLPGTGRLYLHRLLDTVPRVFTQDRIVLSAPEEAKDELLNGDLRRAVFIEESEQLAVTPKNEFSGQDSKRWLERGEEVLSYQEFKGSDANEAVAHFNELQGSNRIGSVRRLSPDRMTIEIEVTRPALLIITDIFHRGWKVRVNGREASPLRVNYLQRGVWLERGRRTVEWVFRPAAVKWGFLLIGLGLIGAVALLVWPRRRR